ncbi:MAG TPA: SprT family zinc-dependent metalloprotease [Candidatus Baltobacteraceae bacterium]|nr:SprT family zinc-dependent metalloprotease [Candidatus Baltobacteraceae bacterium]
MVASVVPGVRDPSDGFVLRRSTRARRPRLTIRPDGTVVVTLPQRMAQRWADQLVAERRAWIARHRARLASLRSTLAARPALGAGRPVSFGGIDHAVSVLVRPERARSRVVHEDEPEPFLRVELAPADDRPPAAVLEAWLRAEARGAVERRVVVRARDLGVRFGRPAIRDQRSRWGSASRRGALSFSWRLVLTPPWVLDYVVVHEVAHLLDFSHSPAFWALVRGLVPEAEAARRWLRSHDAELRHALD